MCHLRTNEAVVIFVGLCPNMPEKSWNMRTWFFENYPEVPYLRENTILEHGDILSDERKFVAIARKRSFLGKNGIQFNKRPGGALVWKREFPRSSFTFSTGYPPDNGQLLHAHLS